MKVSERTPNDTAESESDLARLSQELRRALEQRAAYELEVLNARDHAISQAAHIGELRHRLIKQAAALELRHHEFEIHTGNYRAHIARLEAALAEASRGATRAEKLRGVLETELVAIRASATWKAGRIVMSPVRLLKRLLRRS